MEEKWKSTLPITPGFNFRDISIDSVISEQSDTSS